MVGDLMIGMAYGSRPHRLSAAFGTLLLFLVGCDSAPYDMAPVRGTVTIDGKPLTSGRVMFVPKGRDGGLNSGKPAFGRIQQDGTFVLYTYGDDDGAIVGEHSVTIVSSAEDAATEQNAPKFGRVSLAKSYAVVPDQDNNIKIELTKADVTRRAR
jgi:hypothetical protein